MIKFSGFGSGSADATSSLSAYSPVRKHRGHFRFNTISAVTLLLFLLLAIVLESVLALNVDPVMMSYLGAGVPAAAVLLFLLPWWPTVLVLVALFWAAPAYFGVTMPMFSAVMTLGLLLAPGFEIVSEWDKLVVLRLGRFHRVKGPGVVYLIPMVDSIAGYVDTRIRVTDFSAEKSLTLDTVPVHIDALAFWMIWDAEKAILEVQDFEAAVVLSAQTALRSSIGANTLTSLLSDRERMAEEIQKMVDAKTNPWGITIISVEFKEIIIPAELEDVLSRVAQAERERQSRGILSRAEAEISTTYAEAATVYAKNPEALQLRAMNMVYESIKEKGGLVLTPSAALENMNLGSVLGAAAYGEAAGAVPETILTNSLAADAAAAEDNLEKVPENGEGEKT